MNKKEQINGLMKTIIENKKLKEALLGIANDQCLNEEIENLEERNKLFIFLGMSLALLSYSQAITLNEEKYYTITKNESEIINNTDRISKNKILLDLIADIVKNEVDKEESRVRYHIFLATALSMLFNRNMISINESENYKSPYVE